MSYNSTEWRDEYFNMVLAKHGKLREKKVLWSKKKRKVCFSLYGHGCVVKIVKKTNWDEITSIIKYMP